MPLEESFKVEFEMSGVDDVDRLDGVLLSWDLDLRGDGELVITTRDECKQVGRIGERRLFSSMFMQIFSGEIIGFKSRTASLSQFSCAPTIGLC